MKNVKKWIARAAVSMVSLGVVGTGAYAYNFDPRDEPNTGMPALAAPETNLVPATGAGMPPTAQVFYAVVNSTGTLARGFNATAATRVAAGNYIVTFSHNVSGCAFTATLGIAGNVGVSPPGEITVATANVNANAVFVTTHNSAGVNTDRGFHIHVTC